MRHNKFLLSLVTDEKVLPEFPLIPASRGFCITLCKTLATFKEVLVKKNIIQRPREWQNNENIMELRNNTANQCQEISKSINSKVAECNQSSSSMSNTQESNKKLTLNGNQSIKEVTSSSATNTFATAPSETKKSLLSQNTS